MRSLGAGKVRNYFPSYRVFIYGVEVTPVCTSVRTSWPAGSPMQCTIELANPDNMMTLTQEDVVILAQIRAQKNQKLQQVMGSVDGAYKDVAASLAASLETNADLWSVLTGIGNALTGLFAENEDVRDTADALLNDWSNLYFRGVTPIPPVTAELAAVKNAVIPDKVEKGRFVNSLNGPDGEKLPPEIFYKHPFYEGKSIWHFGDPVSVVFRDPVNPAIWYWTHRGTVTDVAEKETEDLQSVLTITSEGPLKALRNARIMYATGAILTPEVEGIEEDEFFTLLTSVPYSNFLQRLTLRTIIELMIFGSQSLITDLNERVQQGITFEELAERFGVILEGDKRTDRVTQKDIKNYETQLRNLNTTGLKFKRWKDTQGTEVRIVGKKPDSTDLAIGEVVTLYEWQRNIDNRVRVEDIGTMYRQYTDTAQGGDAGGKPESVTYANQFEEVRGRTARLEGRTVEDVITEICSDPETYPINQRVRILMPANLGSRLKTNIVDQDLSSNLSSSAEMYDRLSMLQQTLDRIEFVLYDSPRGDIVVEMPLYDFEPYHFSKLYSGSEEAPELKGGIVRDNPFGDDPATESLNWFQSFGSSGLQELQRIGTFLSGVPAGLFAEHEPTDYAKLVALYEEMTRVGEDDQHYERDFAIYPFEHISSDIGSSEQDVKTAFIVRPRIYPGQADDGSKTAKKAEIAVALNLVPLYGIRVEQGDTYGAITSPEAARVFANIMLNRTNADTVSLRVPCLPNWAAWLNRPIWVARKNFLATSKSISQTIVWQSDANTDYGLWHAKFWDGRMTTDKGVPRPLYVPFGGVNARPFNYAYILGIRDRREDANNSNWSLAEAILSAFAKSGRR